MEGHSGGHSGRAAAQVADHAEGGAEVSSGREHGDGERPLPAAGLLQQPVEALHRALAGQAHHPGAGGEGPLVAAPREREDL